MIKSPCHIERKSVMPGNHRQAMETRMDFWRRALAVLFLFTSLLGAFAKEPTSQPTYFYGPQLSSLVGVIKTVTFPGPPEYQSIKRGDEPEHVLILFLDQPISVLPKEGSKEDLQDPYRNVRKLHLVVHSDDKIKVVKGKRVRVTGTFFSAVTGHHRTEVLMEVGRLEVMK